MLAGPHHQHDFNPVAYDLKIPMTYSRVTIPMTNKCTSNARQENIRPKVEHLGIAAIELQPPTNYIRIEIR